MITFSAVWWFKIMVDRGDGFTVNGFMFVLPILADLTCCEIIWG